MWGFTHVCSVQWRHCSVLGQEWGWRSGKWKQSWFARPRHPEARPRQRCNFLAGRKPRREPRIHLNQHRKWPGCYWVQIFTYHYWLGWVLQALFYLNFLLSLCAAFKSFVLGGVHSCSMLIDGGVMCWGGNDNGQLGTGTFVDMLRPAPVSITGGRFLFGLSIISYCSRHWSWNGLCTCLSATKRVADRHMKMMLNASGIALWPSTFVSFFLL
jgi:hypothetical protein